MFARCLLILLLVHALSIATLSAASPSPGAAAPALGEFPGEWARSIDQAKLSLVQGEVAQVSALPKPATCDYPDCCFTVRLLVKATLSGPPAPKELVLVLPGFYQRRLCKESAIKKGDLLQTSILPFESLPEKNRQTKQADAIDSLELEYFFGVETKPLAAYADTAVRTIERSDAAPLAPERLPGQETVPLPVDKKAQALRAESIKSDLARINALLAAHGGSFDKWFGELASLRSAYAEAARKKSSKWVGDSYFATGDASLDKPRLQNFVAMISQLNQYLKARNIDLILARVPHKGEICIDLFAPLPKDGVSNPYLLEVEKALLEADVETVDVREAARSERVKFPLMYYYQVPDQKHPAEGMAWVVAKEVAKRLQRYPEVQAAKHSFSLTTATYPGHPFMWPQGNPRFDPTKLVEFRAIVDTRDGSKPRFRERVSSPILVMGNSFIGYPALEQAASIPHYLAYDSGVAPDILYRLGSSDLPRFLLRKGPAFLSGRRVCVYPYNPEDLLARLANFPTEINERSIVRLATFEGPKLARLEFTPPLGSHAFQAAADGGIEVRPLKGWRGSSGSIRVPLPKAAFKSPKIVLELVFAGCNNETIAVDYAGERQSISRSPSARENSERFAFRTSLKGTSRSMKVLFVDKTRYEAPTLFKQISIYSAD